MKPSSQKLRRLTLSTLSSSSSSLSVAAVATRQDEVRLTLLFLTLGYALTSVVCLVLIIYLRHNRRHAFRGNATAARKLLLPAYAPLLWILGSVTASFASFFVLARQLRLYTTQLPRLDSEIFYAFRQFVLLLVLVLMLQKSVSIPALKRTIVITTLLAWYTVPIAWYASSTTESINNSVYYWVLLGTRSLILGFYLFVMRWPPTGRASTTSLRQYCGFLLVYFTIALIITECLRRQWYTSAFVCRVTNLLWTSLCPIFIWRILKADTDYWRGVGERACGVLSPSSIQERVSSQGLHVLIEMHRKHVIDFAYLQLRERIGVGTRAVIFGGDLNSTTSVAVKLYTPDQVTDHVVAEFSHEAALCATLKHRNIVKFYGMCVAPPTICLVFERCVCSLDDLLRDQQPSSNQLLLQVGYLLDAARAIAYLHSFKPPFLHRDIKPSNFLIDDEYTVKLSDFGESRQLPAPKPPKTTKLSKKPNVPLPKASKSPRVDLLNTFFIIQSPNNTSHPPSPVKMMTVTGTCDYMAPELLMSKAGIASYDEAVDVYSFAITMWEVLHPNQSKFSNALNESNYWGLMEAVVQGHRPPISSKLPLALRTLIMACWQADPKARPCAHEVVTTLELIQNDLIMTLASDLQQQMEDATSYTSETLVDAMLQLGAITTRAEGLRLENALMETGWLALTRSLQRWTVDESAMLSSKRMTACEKSLLRSFPVTNSSRSDASTLCLSGHEA